MDFQKYTNTVKWTIATYAPTLINEGSDPSFIGGEKKEDLSSKFIKRELKFLKKDYGITDKQSANHCMIFLYHGGCNFDFYKTTIGNVVEEMQQEEDKKHKKKKTLKRNACLNVLQKSHNAGIIGLDLSKGIYLAASLYLTGIYSFEEAMSVSTKMAQKLQATFNSWDEYMENTFLGLQCAYGENPYDNESIIAEEKDIYNGLKQLKDGPYSLDWNTPLIDDWDNNSDILTYPNTIKWFNAAKALLKGVNKETPHLFPSRLLSPDNKKIQSKSLKHSWEIKNTEDAFKAISQLLKGDTHHSKLMEECEYLKMGITLEHLDSVDNLTNEKDYEMESEYYYKLRYHLIETIITKYGDKGIIAWDWFRALHLTSACYVAGHLSYYESLDLSLLVAQEIQKCFSSWDEYIDNYLLGYQYWSGDMLANPDEYVELKENELLSFHNDGIIFRQKLYQWLKNDSESIFEIGWNIKLKKEW